MERVKGLVDKQLQKGAGGGKIQSLNEWLGIVNKFKSNHRRCETNCYIPLPQIEEYIKERRLSYKILSDRALWLFEQERGYYLGYYYIAKEEVLCLQPQDLDVVIYLVGNEKRYAEKREEELLNLGCINYRKNLEYMLTSEKMDELEKMDKKCQRFVQKMNFRYTKFCKEDYEVIFDLWRERIDRYSVKDLLQSRITQMEQEEECIVVRDRDGHIVAACDFEVNGSVAYSENIATNALCNGTGIGGALLVKSFLDIFSKGCKKDYLWVWEDNMESRKITERFATLTGRFSIQLLLEKA